MLLTGSPVSQTVVDTISGKLLGAGGSENEVALNTSVDNLGNDLLVGEADNKTVLGGVAVPKFRPGCRVSNSRVRTTCSSPG